MSKYILSALLILLIPGASMSSELALRGDEAYQTEHYSEAIAIYLEAIEKDGSSSDIYYNLGNAYYRNGQIAEAILSYERALRLNPTNAEARANLAFVNDRITDKKGESGSFLSNSFVSITNLFSSNGWAYVALMLFILTVAGVVVYFFLDSVIVRKIGFFGGILTGIMMIFCMIFAIKAKSMAEDPSDAIIVSETSVLSTVPRAPMTREEEALLLHKGTKVKILRSMSLPGDSSQTWHEVSVDNQHRAWINNDDIERIVEENDK